MENQMKRIIMGLVLGVVCLGATPGLPAREDATATVIKPCVVITGADSQVSERGYHRATTMDGWTQIWLKHKGHEPGGQYDLIFNPAGVPLVDFDRFMVIGVFQGGGWNSAGLWAVSISEQPDRIVFRFDDHSYQTAGPNGGGKHVTVYGFFVTPRSAKPVVLEENVQRLIGKPPVWKERITFPKL